MAQERKLVGRTRFNQLMYEHLKATCGRLGVTQEDLATQLGLTRQSLSSATRKKRAIGFEATMKFAEAAQLTNAQKDELGFAWIEDRITEGTHGHIVKLLLNYMETRLSEREVKSLRDQMLRAQLDPVSK